KDPLTAAGDLFRGSLTPEQRRFRIYGIAETDERYRKAKEYLDSAQNRFARFTDKLPGFLWTYPGMLFFMHHRLLAVICEHMIFPDERK
ncbi:MAG TPA: hypothetical protein DDY90_07115, partial [Clostridiales bacterium]|nr:hypothetical protein [Clostridiales bacterium]